MKEKGFEDCFFKKALLGAKVKLRGSGYGYKTDAQSTGNECFQLIVFYYVFVDIYS